MYLKMLFFDRYHLGETRLSGIEIIRKAGVIEQKRQNRKKAKKKKKRGIKDHLISTLEAQVATVLHNKNNSKVLAFTGRGFCQAK